MDLFRLLKVYSWAFQNLFFPKYCLMIANQIRYNDSYRLHFIVSISGYVHCTQYIYVQVKMTFIEIISFSARQRDMIETSKLFDYID